MLGSPGDKEICLFSLSLAKNLIQKTLQNVEGDIEEMLDAKLELNSNIPTQIIETSDSPHNKSSPINLDSPRSNPDNVDPPLEVISHQDVLVQESPCTQIEHNIEIKGSSSYLKESHPSEATTEPGSDRMAMSDQRYEASISQIFDRPAYTESSIFPFSFLGEAPEALYQRYKKEGVLYKKSSSVFIGWQKRYFEVRGFKIYYSKSQEMLIEKKELRCINLFVSPCKISEVKGQTFQISIEGVKKKLNLKASSLSEARAWVDFLQELFTFINENQSKASRYVNLKRQKLLKLDILTEEEFIDKADTGDILLFQSSHFGARVQRTFTSSKYDHVGLIVKAFDDLYLYDSVCDGGVQLTHWKDFKALEYHKDYVRIAYRKLEIQDPAIKSEIHENFFKFVTAHTGRKYELSFKKLLKRTSIIPQQMKEKAEQKIPITSQEGFFCSELVAAAYKAVGLLDPVIASSRYYPVSFSHKRPLKLLREVSLSNEFGLALTDEKAK